MAYFLQQTANAFPLAATYAALAFGYAMVFGLTKRTDFAFGALFAFGGQIFVLFAAFAWSELSLVLAATYAIGAGAAVCYVLGAGWLHSTRVVAPLLHARPNAIVAASLAVMLILMELARVGTQAQLLWLAPVFNEPVQLYAGDGFPVTLTQLQIASVLAIVALIGTGQAILRWTSAGRFWRAVSDDPLASALCGINAERVLTITYAVAILLACVVAILTTLHFGTMDIGASLIFGLKVVFIAAIGGSVSPGRAALGAVAIAFGETMWSAYAALDWRDLAIFAALIFVAVTRRGAAEQP